jgi:hypothetical protein
MYFAAASLYNEAEVKMNFRNFECVYNYRELLNADLLVRYPDLENLKSYASVADE